MPLTLRRTSRMPRMQKSNDYGGPEPADRRLLILGVITIALLVWFLIGD